MTMSLIPDDDRLRYSFFASIVLALVLRLRGITESIWVDESISLLQAQPSLLESIQLVQADVHVPLYTLLLNVWTSVFGQSVFAARILSVLLSIATVFAIFAFCKRFFDERVGVYASWLFAASEILIYYGQEIRPYSLFVFLTVASFYTYGVYRESKKGLPQYTVINAALCYTHPFAAFAIATQAVHYAYDFFLGRTTWSDSFRLAGSYFVTGLLFSPWLPTLFEQAQRSTLTWIPETTVTLVLEAYRTYFELPGTIIVLGLLLYTAWRHVRRNEPLPDTALVLAWILVPLFLLLAVSILFRPFFHQRYLLFTAPALYIFVAVMIRRVQPISARRVLFVGLVASFIITPMVYGASERDDWKGVASYLETHRETAPILVQPYYHQQPLTYYYNKECFSPDGIFNCNKEKADIQSITRHNCCSVSELDEDKLSYHLPESTYWLILVRDDPKGERILDHAQQTAMITMNASFKRGIRVYKVNGS